MKSAERVELRTNSKVYLLLALLSLVLPPSAAPAATVHYSQSTINDADGTVIGAVSSSQWLETGSSYPTTTAPSSWSSYRFTHWTVSSTPAETYRDAWGRSLNPVSFTLLEETTATAHYLPATRDSDTDTVPDWYEIEYYGTLTHTGTSDTDGDGLTLAQEYSGGTNPLHANASQPGGISWADSALVTCNLAGYPTYVLRSIPAGTVNQTVISRPGAVITTTSLAGNAAFGYWALDGVRQQDAWGVAVPQVAFTMGSTDRECVAYMFTGDTDADGVADAYEQYYYGTLDNSGTSDTDGDGITLLAEKSGGTNPLHANASQEGGISWADSAMVVVNLANYSRYTFRSEPPGTVNQSAVVPDGTVVTTPDMTQTSFGYWTLDGVRQQDAWGVAVRQLSVTVSGSDREAVAYLFTGDSDGDNVPDAYEQYHFATLTHVGTADSDGDSLTLLQEYTGGTNPLHANSSQPGGISWADSGLIVVNLQPFERPVKILVGGTLQNFFALDPAVPGGVLIGAEPAAGPVDWDGDGDFDLFVAHAAGLRLFRNIGTSGNPNFEEVFDGFGGLASYIAALDHPVIAGGDWSGDGIGDLVIGGSTGTLRLVASSGTFASDGTGLDLPTGSTVSLPALGDFDGDKKLDLLVLLDNGTVRFHANSGLAVPFVNPGVDNYLGTAVPNATSIAAGDLDQDGLCDVLVADAEGRIWEFHRQAGGGFALTSKVWGGSGAGFASGMTIAAWDLENDGDTDVIAGLANGSLLALRDPGVGRPAELVAEAGVDSVKLSWDANTQSRIRGYKVFRATDAAGPYEPLTTEPTALPSLLDREVSPGTAYHYYVRGVSYFFVPGNSEPRLIESLPSDTVLPTAGRVSLGVQSVSGAPGSYIQVPVSINNSIDLRGQDLAISVTYDPQVLIPAKQANATKNTVILTGLSNGLTVSDNGATASGTVTISGSAGQIHPGSGKLFMIQFRVSESAVAGQTRAIAIPSAMLYATAGYQAVIELTGGAVFTVSASYQAGDIDGNGAVTSADDALLQALIKPKARKPTAEELRAGDLNGNGRLDYQDAILLKRLLAGLSIN